MVRIAHRLVGLGVLALVASTGTSSCGGVYSGPRCDAEFLACGRQCVDPSTDRHNCGGCDIACGPTDVCTHGACGLFCGPGATACGSRCVETAFNPASCGDCGNVCDGAQLCSNGVCDDSCTGATSRCGDRCRDLSVDPEACGRCSVACDPGQVCASGECRLDCPSGLEKCDGLCVDVRYDIDHCGGCDGDCPIGQLCSSGVCADTCGGGTTACDAHCVDTSWDPAHCGRCDHPCPSGQLCSLGECTELCGGGRTACQRRCVDLDWDPTNCGDCGTVCERGRVCSEGVCTTHCGGGSKLCGERCVFVDRDPANCGSCGNVCPDDQLCSDGECRINCGAPLFDCGDGACINLEFSDDNCGACGRACPNDQVCWRHTCITPEFSGKAAGAFVPSASGAPPDLPALSDMTPLGWDTLYSGVRVQLSSFSSANGAWVDESSPPVDLEPAGGLAWVDGVLYASASRILLRYDIVTGWWDQLGVPHTAAEGTQLTHDDLGTIYLLGTGGRVLFFDTYSQTMSRDEATILKSNPYRPRLAWDRLTARLYVAPRIDEAGVWEYDPVTASAVELPRSTNDAIGTAFCTDGSGHLYTRGDAGSSVWQFTTWDQSWRVFDEAPFSLQPGALCTVFESGHLYLLNSPQLAHVRLGQWTGR